MGPISLGIHLVFKIGCLYVSENGSIRSPCPARAPSVLTPSTPCPALVTLLLALDLCLCLERSSPQPPLQSHPQRPGPTCSAHPHPACLCFTALPSLTICNALPTLQCKPPERRHVDTVAATILTEVFHGHSASHSTALPSPQPPRQQIHFPQPRPPTPPPSLVTHKSDHILQGFSRS